MLKNFVDLDGNESWLKGIDYLPEKLKNLLTINKILAHQPWLITHNHIQVCYTTSMLALIVVADMVIIKRYYIFTFYSFFLKGKFSQKSKFLIL